MKVAEHVGHLISGFDPGDIEQVSALQHLLGSYADALRPWATQVTKRMLAEVNERNIDAWRSLGQQISVQLRHDILRTDVGRTMRALLDSQVDLIRSLPIEAGERVHRLTIEGLETSSRGAEIREEIMRSGEVTESRAILIARTETSRTATVLTQARALSAGSDGYFWRTAKDSSVRPSHQAMQGKFVRWDSPPTLDNLTGHAGALPNCRCYCEPHLPGMET